MKRIMNAITRMFKAIDHMLDNYEKAIDDIKGTPAYFDLYAGCEMM